MKMVTGLTKANASKYGIELSPEHDFTDDGNRFRGFIYKGLVMTQCRTCGECYLSIRVDYQKNNFTWNEWSNTEEYRLCDEFNGVSEFDIEKLVENLERIIAKVKEMNDSASVSEDDIEEVKSIVRNEISEMKVFLDDIKSRSFEWWNADQYCMKQAAYYIHSIEDCMRRGNIIIDEISTWSVGDQRTRIEAAKRSKAAGKDFLNWKWYIERVTEYMEKAIRK